MKKYLMTGTIGLVLIFLWNASEAQEKAPVRRDSEGKVRVVNEKGPSGHQTIGIDESSLSVDSKRELPLTFSMLMKWDYRIDRNAPPPESIKGLDGRTVRLAGFMYPLQEGKAIQYFCLIRTTQTCCYGPRPQFNQYVLVEMEKSTRFYRLDPVSCVGTFRVEPTPEEGFIYRMEGKSCEPASP